MSDTKQLAMLIAAVTLATQVSAQTPATILKTKVVLTDRQIRNVGIDYRVVSPLPTQMVVPIMCILESHLVADYSNISSGTDSYIEVWTRQTGNMEFGPIVNDQNQVTHLLAPGFGNPINMITYLHPALYFDANFSSTVPLVPAVQSSSDFGVPLVYHHFNPGGNLTGGDPDNTLTLSVWYVLYPE